MSVHIRVRTGVFSLAAALIMTLHSTHAYDITGKAVDSAGAAVAGAKVWLQGDTTQSTLTDATGGFHFTGSPLALRPIGAPVGHGLALLIGRGGEGFLDVPHAMPLTLTLSTLDGRSIRARETISVAAGKIRLESLTGHLMEGAYALTLKGTGVSLKLRIVKGAALAMSGQAEEGSAAKGAIASARGGLAKASADLVDLNGKAGIVIAKDGYVPALHVPLTDIETGVQVGLKKPIGKPGHIIVIYLENWSFDALYGEFPGAEGLAQAYAADPQRDTNGVAYAKLPRPWNTDAGKSEADSLFPDTLSNKPFAISDYTGLDKTIPDLVHRFYQEQLQIHGGKNDQFVAVSNARGLSMGYFHTDSLPLAAYAKQYTLCDHFFHSSFGGSFLNHQWMVAARTPLWKDIPAKYRATLDGASGKIKKNGDRAYADGQATPEGYLINTIYTHNNPHPATAAADQLVPDLDYPTIGDRLSEKGISWAWYSGGWDSATAGRPDSAFQFHHQPFAFFKNYGDGTPGKAAHLKDEADFNAALKAGTLPAVTFLKPVGINNEHPSYTDVKTGEVHTASIIEAIKASSIWNDAVILVTYDENGGFYDHVAPPVIDRWGPGVRVPTLIISPFAKKAYVDKHVYETVSILSLIERRYGLVPLSSRDASAADLTAAMDLPAL